MSTFEVKRASELQACPDAHRWLVHGLWADQAVGIVGGEPKCCKSFLALDLAVAVASGTACLRRYHPAKSGPVLLYAAEDALHVVRTRLQGICEVAGVPFDRLNVHVITVPSVRIDLDADRRRLQDTVAAIRPLLLVLDPFVRLHRIDENASSEVAPLLAFLRDLQRHFETAVLLVHHSRKGAAGARAGQALRGSSELHAWGDSNLYLRRQRDQLLLSIEHRAAPSVAAQAIALSGDHDAVALRVLDQTISEPSPLPLSATERVLQILADADQPLSRRALRAACRMKASSVGSVLSELIASGQAIETDSGYSLAAR
jgi:RecA-family ATPase